MSKKDETNNLAPAGTRGPVCELEPNTRKQRTNNIYSRLARLYSFFRVKDGLSTVLDLMKLQDGHNVLDIGTGPGVYALHIAKSWPSCSVHGLDPCERFLDIARKRALKLGSGNIRFTLGEAEKLHFGDDTFDRILFAGTLVLVPDKVGALRETYRVLRPGGIAVFKELLHKRFIHKELFYVFWGIYVKALGIFHRELRGIKRSDYEGRKLTESGLTSLIKESPFSDFNVFIKGTRLYAVCRK